MISKSTICTRIALTLVCALTAFLFLFTSEAAAQRKPTLLSDKVEKTVTGKPAVQYFQSLASDYVGERNNKNGPDPAKLKVLRNRMIFMSIAQIDLNFKDYRRKRRIGNDLFQTAMDILELAGTTAATIVNGTRAKDVITNSVTLLQGSRSATNKNLKLVEMQILFNMMDEGRAKAKTDILNKINLEDSVYPFEFAYVDLADYYLAGTWDFALASLSRETGKAAAEAVAALQDAEAGSLRPGSVTTAQATAILKASFLADKIAGSVDQDKESAGKLKALFGLIAVNDVLSPEFKDFQNETSELGTLAKQVGTETESIEAKQYARILRGFVTRVQRRLSMNPAMSESLLTILSGYQQV